MNRCTCISTDHPFPVFLHRVKRLEVGDVFLYGQGPYYTYKHKHIRLYDIKNREAYADISVEIFNKSFIDISKQRNDKIDNILK